VEASSYDAIRMPWFRYSKSSTIASTSIQSSNNRLKLEAAMAPALFGRLHDHHHIIISSSSRQNDFDA